MLHIHTTEIEQSHRIRPDMCPIIELYNEEVVLVSIDCSSNEMRIANNQHHVTADVHVMCLYIHRDRFSIRSCDYGIHLGLN